MTNEEDEDATKQQLDEDEDATKQQLEEYEDATEQHLEDEADSKQHLEEDSTPEYVTPGTTRMKRNIVKRPRLTARKRVKEMKEFWKKEVEGQTEKEASKIYEAMMFSPGPGQVSSTKMKKIMGMIVEERVKEALEERLNKAKPKSLARKLFEEDEETKRHKARVEQMIQQDERLREEKTKETALPRLAVTKPKAKAKSSSSQEAPKERRDPGIRDEETRRKQKKSWKHEQDMIKKLKEELEVEKKKNHDLEEQW